MESTLSQVWNDILGEVGFFLGHGRGAANGDPPWTDKQTKAIDFVVRSGLRQFYFPPPLEGSDSAYDWSFLKPTGSVTLALGASTVPLPDDFGGIEGEISVRETSNQVSWPIPIVNPGQVRQKYSEYPTTTGRPVWASVDPLKGTTGTQGQRCQLLCWPLADQAYVFQFAYYILPDYLSGAFPFPYGGMAHAETILESCLAIAEQRIDDSSNVHSMKFQERLAASVSLDRRNKAQKIGYNRDQSDQPDWTRRDQHYLGKITVGGVQY